MHRFLLLLSLLLVGGLAGCATPLETIHVPDSDISAWHVGYAKDHGSGEGTIVEFVPNGESINAWRQLLTIQFLEGSPLTAAAMVESLRTTMRERCPSVEWSVLGEDPSSTTYEWSVATCAGTEAQHEIARLMRGNDGLHRIAYTVKGATMDPAARQHWIDILGRAVLVKGEDMEPVVLR